MKNKLKLAAFGLLLSLVLQPSTSRAQGSLTPPGPPAPTMKSLDQIEPRTPILSAPFTITQPGSYYLASNVVVSSGSAIIIATSSVTLDLRGFTISSTAGSAAGYGVLLNSGLQNITIVNGFIQSGVTNNGFGVYGGSGFAYGIAYAGAAPANARVSGISVSGCLDYGIYLGGGSSTVVDSCTVQTVGSYGIVASTVTKCVAWNCGSTAIAGDQVSDCRGLGGSGGDGISATVTQNCQGQGGSAGISSSAAFNCYGYCFNGPGLSVSTAENCYGQSFNNDGIDTTTALNSHGSGSAQGIYAVQNAQNCTGSSSGSGSGIYAVNIAESCYGSSASGTGVFAGATAQNCVGSSSSGNGITTSVALNCDGYTGGGGGSAVAGISCVNAMNCDGSNNGGGYGIYAGGAATGCYGFSYSGTGIDATLGDSSLGDTSAGTPFSVSHNVNTFVY